MPLRANGASELILAGLCEIETNPRFSPVIESISGLTAKGTRAAMPGFTRSARSPRKTISKMATQVVMSSDRLKDKKGVIQDSSYCQQIPPKGQNCCGHDPANKLLTTQL